MIIKIRQPLYFSEIGRKDNQEDYLWPLPEKASKNNRIFLMCDGMGGADSGEVASQTAATALGTYLTEHPSNDGIVTKAMFEAALAYAYDELDKVDTGAVRKMGTTMTCLVLHRGGALVAHIGDSRIYQVRPSLSTTDGRTGIVYQSADHSLVNDLLRVGEITEEEAANFPQKNVITRAMQPHLERRHKADIYNLEDVQDGDFFFLCCDGVLEQLTNDKLGEILADKSLDDKEKLDAIHAVCHESTHDNYTCWLIPIDKVEREATDCLTDDDEVVAIIDDEPTQRPLTAPQQEGEVKCKVEEARSPIKRYVFSIIAVCLLLAIGWTAKSMISGEKKQEAESMVADTTSNGIAETATPKANASKQVEATPSKSKDETTETESPQTKEASKTAAEEEASSPKEESKKDTVTKRSVNSSDSEDSPSKKALDKFGNIKPTEQKEKQDGE